MGANIIFNLFSYLFIFHYSLHVNALPQISNRRNPLSDFYELQDPINLEDADDVAVEIPLKWPVFLYDQSYSSVFISTNGLVTFGSNYSNYEPQQFPLPLPAIAIFYSDVDTRYEGYVRYRVVTSENLETSAAEELSRASNLISRNFNLSNFQAQQLVIVSWEEVSYYNTRDDKLNTFQLLIASDASDSYCLFLYALLEWELADAKDGKTAIGAQAGFIPQEREEKQMLLLKRPDESSDVLLRQSNYGEPGRWIFHIGSALEARFDAIRQPQSNLVASNKASTPDYFDYYGEELRVPDVDYESVVDANRNIDCEQRSDCDVNAECMSGCCECAIGYVGNGVVCLKEDRPIQITGQLRGSVNNEQISATVFNTISLREGRCNGAIGGISPSLAAAMKTMVPLASSLAWLFAAPTDRDNPAASVGRGVTYAGFELDSSLTLTYPQSNQEITILTSYGGMESPDSFVRVSMQINGSAPLASLDSKVEGDSQSVKYIRTAPGIYEASWTVTASVANGENFVINAAQIIRFNECNDQGAADLSIFNDRPYNMYDIDGEQLRYQVLAYQGDGPMGSNSAGLFEPGYPTRPEIVEQDDLCLLYPLPEDSVCSMYEDRARYDCVPGLKVTKWEPYGDSYKPVCEDIDECIFPPPNYKCHEQADCINSRGSYSCQCRPGFYGDGTSCSLTPSDPSVAPPPPFGSSPIPSQMCRQDCDSNSECVYNEEYNSYGCQCREGFLGDGYVCTPKDPNARTCLEYTDLCDSNADCIDGRCECRSGYEGDGLICVIDTQTCDVKRNCDEKAECVFDEFVNNYICRCMPGYEGDGYYCRRPDQIDPEDCSLYPTICDRNAVCHQDRSTGRSRCKCRDGFEGNGIACVVVKPSMESCYYNREICHSNANCEQERVTSEFTCKCRPGFIGDGFSNCSPAPKGGFIVFAQGPAVLRQYVDPTNSDPGEEIAMERGRLAIAVAADCADQTVYWSDIRAKRISLRSYANKSETLTFPGSEQTGSVEGIAIDHQSRNIFWTDSSKDVIVVANIDNPQAGQKVLVSQNLVNPRSLAILPQRGLIFWSDWDRENPRIMRAVMDGSNARIIISNATPGVTIILPNAIVIDEREEKLYWADAGDAKKSKPSRLMRSSLDGTDVELILTDIGHPFGLTLLEGNLYWTDWNKNKIFWVPKHGGKKRALRRQTFTASGKVYGITSVPEQCASNANSRCAIAAGMCRESEICLPLPQGRDECVCPDDMMCDDM